MPNRTRCVIAYDIADDRRRTKLARLLLNLGERVQHSVFEAELSPREVEELLRRASKYVQEDESLCIYPLCGACVPRVQRLGREGPLSDEDLCII